MADSAIDRDFTPSKTEERVGLLTRLRQNLLAQREKFRSYLSFLEEEEQSIKNGNLGMLDRKVQLEGAIMNELQSLHKTIVPLHALYEKTHPNGDVSIDRLQNSVRAIKEQVRERSEGNRLLLGQKMAQIRQEIKWLRRSAGNSFNKDSGKPLGNSISELEAPAFVDIST